VHQLVNINIYIKMHGTTIKIKVSPMFIHSLFSYWIVLYLQCGIYNLQNEKFLLRVRVLKAAVWSI